MDGLNIGQWGLIYKVTRWDGRSNMTVIASQSHCVFPSHSLLLRRQGIVVSTVTCLQAGK